MKKTVLRYGLYSAITIVVLFVLGWMVFDKNDLSKQEIFGYTSMVLSMLPVFFGIKHYRDKQNGGSLTFGKAMKVGLLIVLIPSLIFGVFDVIYVLFLEPGFMEKYYSMELSRMQRTMTASEFQTAKASMEMQKEIFSNPVFQFLIMFLTVFVIGVIVTVISGLVLRREVRR